MSKPPSSPYDAVVIGVSSGGLSALSTILPKLPEDFPASIIVVQHMSPGADDFLARHLDNVCALKVREAEDKDILEPGRVYIAPPNYHLMVEEGGALALSIEPRVNYSRPSVDVLFETAADAFADRLVGVVLTGANNDGAKGLKRIKQYGGLTIVQSPDTAQAGAMPRAAMETAGPHHVLPLDSIAPFLIDLFRNADNE
ncbi:MAG: chemotaxis protein CheB [Thermodesulfobacteriota bacterium]